MNRKEWMLIGYQAYQGSQPLSMANGVPNAQNRKSWKIGWHKGSIEAWRDFYFDEPSPQIKRRLTL